MEAQRAIDRRFVEPREKRIEGIVEGNVDSAATIADGLPTDTPEHIGSVLRGVAEAEQDALKATFSPKFEAFASGPAGQMSGHAGPLKDLATNMLEEQRGALLKSLQRDNTNLVAEASGDAKNKYRTIESIAKGRVVSVKQIQRALRDINADLQKKRKGLSSEGADVATLERLKGTLKATRAEILKNEPEMLDQIVRLEDDFRKAKALVDRSIIGDITRVRNGRIVLRDQDIMKKVMRAGNVEDARRMADAIRNSPEAQLAVRDGVYQMYIDRVIKSTGHAGRTAPDKRAHDKFMRDFGEQIDIFFVDRFQNVAQDRALKKNLRKLGGLAGVIKKQRAQQTDMIKKLRKSFPSQVVNLDPEKIATFVLDKEVTGRALKLRKILQQDPEALGAVQNQIATTIRNKVTRNGEFVSAELDNLLTNTGSANLSTMMGPRYARDLATLRDAVKLMEKRSGLTGGSVEPTNTVFNAVIQTFIAPPLSRRGRALTATNRARKSAAVRALGEALQSPELLKQFVEARRTNIRTKRGVELLASLSALELAMD